MTSTTYNPATNQIIAYFIRGNMPNEAYGQDSQMNLSLERLRGNRPSTFVANYSLDEMIYDLNAAPTYATFIPRVSVGGYTLSLFRNWVWFTQFCLCRWCRTRPA